MAPDGGGSPGATPATGTPPPAAKSKHPLLAAVQGGSATIVKLLLDKTRDAVDDVRAPGTDNTALHLAAAEGKLDVLKILLPAFASSCAGAARGGERAGVNARNANGDTPLMFACARGRTAAAAALLNAGASADATNKGKSTPLMFASHANEALCVEILLRAKASVEAQDAHGRRALHYAVEAGAWRCVDALIETGGADVFARDRDGRVPSAEWHQHGVGEDARRRCRDALERETRRRTEARRDATAALLAGEADGRGDEGGGDAPRAKAEASSGSSGGGSGKKKKKSEREGGGKKRGPKRATDAGGGEEGVSTGKSDDDGSDGNGDDDDASPALTVNDAWAAAFAAMETNATPEASPSSPGIEEGTGGGGGGDGDDDDGFEKVVSKRKAKGGGGGGGGSAVPQPAAVSKPKPAKAPPPRPAPQSPAPPASSATSWATMAGSKETSSRGQTPLPPPPTSPPPPPMTPTSPPPRDPSWIAEATRRLESTHVTAAALEVTLAHVCGVGIDTLSYSQLEVVEEIHRDALARCAEARIELVRTQERVKAAAAAEIERLRAALADATTRGGE